MNILFAGGGTAGHITPAIAIAEEFLKTDGSRVAFVGRAGGTENRLITNKNYELFCIKARGMERKLSISGIQSIVTNLFSVITSHRIIKKYKPDAVIGTGGYVCWPVLLAARIAGVPTFIHESNLFPGMATRNLSPSCKKVLLNYEGSRKYFKKADNTVVVGNPVREEFEKITRSEARRQLGISESTVLTVSFGGSGGSDKINQAMLELMKKSTTEASNVHIHATGQKYYERIREENPLLLKASAKRRVVPYIDDMPTVLSAADIIICRCGAMTLSEISAVGIPSILIPSPNVTDDHQRKNAEHMVKQGAAIMIEENELEFDKIYKTWLSLYNSKRKRQAMGRAAKEMFVAEAAKKIKDTVLREI